jgi:glycosidase
MPFPQTVLGAPRPARVRSLPLPRREPYHPSPGDWRDEVLYFLLPDRFSDGREGQRPPLDRGNLAAARPAQPEGGWRWDRWAASGADRWQGGTLRGITSQLDYLRDLGVTTLWVGPVFKQRGHLNTYHGYGVQDFLEVDPHLGDRADLVELVRQAHARGLRIILDVIFNHSGANWLYPAGTPGGESRPRYTGGRYPFGAWRGDQGQPVGPIQGDEDGVWPAELQDTERYTRAGRGDLGAGSIEDPEAEHKRSDFEDLRDFRLAAPELLSDLARCYKYWIALADFDGMRIDTLKHVSLEEARNFCGTIKEFAANLGKHDFFLVGEVAGGDRNARRYLEVAERNLNAALDIGEMRLTLNGVAKGLIPATAYFDGFNPGLAVLGSHRNLGSRHVSVLDDHDHVFGEKVRFSTGAASDHQVAAAVALQLFTLGIPCLYYGTEQAFAGPEPSEQRWLPSWRFGDGADRYLREAMFGPEHPRKDGRQGLQTGSAALDDALPGFGPFGTAGRHCFDRGSAAFVRIAAMTGVRARFPVLRYGRQYQRPVSFLGRPLAMYGPGEIAAWSRILDDEEALCVVNVHGRESRGADVVVDAALNGAEGALTVVLNTAQAASGGAYTGTHPVASTLPVKRAADGTAYVEVRDVGPSEVLVLTNRPDAG